MSDALERQQKISAVLADRISILWSTLSEEQRVLVTGFDSGSEYTRAQMRCATDYDEATASLREMSKEILRQIYGGRHD